MAPKTRSTKSKKRKAVDDSPPPDDGRPAPSGPPAPSIPYQDITDRSLVTGPVDALIGKRVVWAMPHRFSMCIVFDSANPLRIFKRGTVFNEQDDDPFPTYTLQDHGNVTETDDEGTLQPYRPEGYKCVHWIYIFTLPSLIYGIIVRPKYRFSCDLKLESFMDWTDGKVHEINYGRLRKIPDKKTLKWSAKIINIHIQYARVIQQFVFEDNHAKQNKGHEALRRRTYAQRVLDRLGMELDSWQRDYAKDGWEWSHFRSTTLTPILQRQLRGVPDAYGPAIRKAITPSNSIPTIGQATTFYLGVNPLSTGCIPYYRRHLLYVREARWHLAILMGKVDIKSVEDFDRSLRHHDVIMDALCESPRPTPGSIPPLNQVEAVVITVEGIDEFFRQELSWTVSIHHRSILPHSHRIYLQPDIQKHAQEWKAEQQKTGDVSILRSPTPGRNAALITPVVAPVGTTATDHESDEAPASDGDAVEPGEGSGSEGVDDDVCNDVDANDLSDNDGVP